MNSGAASPLPIGVGARFDAQEPAAPTGRITEPSTGTIVALDPDIPPRNQRLRFAAEGEQLRWLMDGKEFAKGRDAKWMPWPGKHVVQIADGRGRVLDEIRLEVRGAGVRASQPTPTRASGTTPPVRPLPAR